MNHSNVDKKESERQRSSVTVRICEPTPDAFMPSVKGEILSLNWLHSKRMQNISFGFDKSVNNLLLSWHYYYGSFIPKMLLLDLRASLELEHYHRHEKHGHNNLDCSCSSSFTFWGVCVCVCVLLCCVREIASIITLAHTNSLHTASIINGARSFLQW